jgi:hypothetical protein
VERKSAIAVQRSQLITLRSFCEAHSAALLANVTRVNGLDTQGTFVRLLDATRVARRTIADAIEVLREKANFEADDRANVHVGLLALPAGNIAGLIDVQLEKLGLL